MGAVLDQAVAELNRRMAGKSFDGTAKFVLTGEGSLVVDGAGAREGDDPADVTLTAAPDTFQQIVAGDLDATAAFMTGKLQLDGDMSRAMQLASLLG
jgi:putative sterol carrier protein